VLIIAKLYVWAALLGACALGYAWLGIKGLKEEFGTNLGDVVARLRGRGK
jgi:hypothetical protein